MAVSESGAQTSHVRCGVQADPGTVAHARAVCLLLALLLGGCSSQDWSSINPINWWHHQEGGAIAQQRPPPPGANEPPPNLASVPQKPPEPDRAALQDITDALVGDRAHAERMAAAAPLTDPSLPSASPGLFGVGTTPPPGPPPPPGAESATLAAANAPPTPATPPPPSKPAAPPAKAPVGEVKSAALPTPTPPPGPLSVGSQLPPLPSAPPPPANVAGMPTPPAPTATAAAAPTPAAVPAPAPPQAVATPAPPAPPPPPAATAAAAPSPPAAPAKPPAPTAMASITPPTTEPVSAGNTVAVVFASGVSEMPPSSSAPLRALAGKRGDALIAVTGYGDAQDSSPEAQAAALKLGLARAQSIAAALVADGVPASAVQIDAQAMGRGGTARLVQ